MKLIADSGATNTDWVFSSEEEIQHSFQSQGLHPSFHSSEELEAVLSNHLPSELNPKEIYFYGTGCASLSNINKIHRVLQRRFPKADLIEIQSDLLGASRALFQNDPGWVGILGTGSNSCFYDGVKNQKKFPSLGYILGDEGSGAHLGKHFLRSFFAGHLPTEITREIKSSYGSNDDIIQQIYTGKHPNRYLAGFAKTMHNYRDLPEVKKITDYSFDQFITNQVMIYPEVRIHPIGIVGSIANYFKNELLDAFERNQLSTPKLIKEPIFELAKFHKQ